MATKLSSLRTMRNDKPPRFLVYGTPGIGKTSLASEFPSPVFLEIEDGTPADVELVGWEREDLRSFTDVMDALVSLYEDQHDFRTLVVDSATALQKLVFAETCARGDDKGNSKANIEDFGYGKGYVYAQKVFEEFLEAVDALRRDRGMAVVIIAHSKVERFDDPETVSYDRYEIDLNPKLVGMLERDMDGILLLKKPVTVKAEEQGFNRERAIAQGGADTIYVHTSGKPAFVAKNRFRMPAQILYKRGSGYAELAKYLPGAAPAPASETAAAEPAKAAGRGRASK